MAKIFVTGATGQVGSRVAEYIVKEKLLGVTRGKDVICLVRNPDKASFLKDLGVTIVKGDLQDSDTITAIMNNGVEFVFHVAANCLLNQSYMEMYIPNVLGTRIILDAFIKSKAKCFVHTSSIAVYSAFLGRKKVYNIDEKYPIGSLKGDPYSVTKRIAENLVSYYSERNPGKFFITTRLGPIIGAGDKQTVPALVDIMSYRFLPKLINGGKDLFSITSSYDVARAQVFLATRAKSVSGQAFNIARYPTNYRHMMDVIASYYHRKPPSFSMKYWFFKFTLPFLKMLKTILPRVKLLRNATSPVAVNYIGKSYIYSSEKIKEIGFDFIVSPKEAIYECLEHLDPEKKLVKVGKEKNADPKEEILTS